jgi:tetratricopeptide (TPR) repeat protein
LNHRTVSFVIIALLLSIQGHEVLAQVPNITDQKVVDSLFKILRGTQGTARVDVLNQLSFQLGARTFDSSLLCAKDALRLSRQIGYTKGEGVATFSLGNSYFFKPDLKNSLVHYLAALRILEKYEPSHELADLLYQLALVNQFVRNNKKVNAYFRRSAYNYAAIGDTLDEKYGLVIFGYASFFELQTLKTFGKVPDSVVRRMMDTALKYNGIGFEYFTKRHPMPDYVPDLYNGYALFNREKNEPGVLDYYMKALEATRAITDTNWKNVMQGVEYGNLGDYYFTVLHDLDKAYTYSIQSEIAIRKTDRYDLYSSYLNLLGEIEMERGRYEKARRYQEKALRISDTLLNQIGRIKHGDPAFRIWGITQTRSTRIDIFKDLVRLYELQDNFSKALEYQKKIDNEKSLLVADELSRQVMGLEAEFEDEMKQKEIDRLRKDNEFRLIRMHQTRMLYTGIGSLLMILLLTILFWLQRKRFKSDRKALVLEQKLLRSQMNPHFLFNALTGIQNFIVAQKPDKASIYLSKFANLVRNILDNSVEELVPLEKEISTIENYLELQKVRYAGKFDYHIEIDDNLDPETVMIPPMLAQPFIENSIEHGIKHRETT